MRRFDNIVVGNGFLKIWPKLKSRISSYFPRMNGELFTADADRLEWLRDSPASRKTKELADHIAKIDLLKKLGAERLDLGLAAGMLKTQALSMRYRKPATIKRMR